MSTTGRRASRHTPLSHIPAERSTSSPWVMTIGPDGGGVSGMCKVYPLVPAVSSSALPPGAAPRYPRDSVPMTRRSGCLPGFSASLLAVALATPAIAQPPPSTPPAPARSPAEGAAVAGSMLQRASDRIRALQREADLLAKQSTTTLAALRKLELTRALRAEELAAVNTRLSAVTAKVAASTVRVQALEDQRVDRTPALEERLQALYKRGRHGLRAAAARHGRRARPGARQPRVVSLARIEEIRIAEHRRLLAEEQAARAQLESEQRQVARLSAEADEPRGAAASAVAERTRLLDELDRRRELAAQLRRRARTGAPTASVDPRRAWAGRRRRSTCRCAPSRATCRGRGRARCCRASADRRPAAYGTSIQRNGIEIGAAQGSPVRAVHGGTVAYAAPFTGYGVMVILDHGEDAFTVYGHLSGTALRPGAIGDARPARRHDRRHAGRRAGHLLRGADRRSPGQSRTMASNASQ